MTTSSQSRIVLGNLSTNSVTALTADESRDVTGGHLYFFPPFSFIAGVTCHFRFPHFGLTNAAPRFVPLFGRRCFRAPLRFRFHTW